jgi:hypothetical protein
MEMKSMFSRALCRILIAGMIVLPWQAQAGMIGTDQALSAAQQRAAHARVAATISRSDVAAQLQLLGVSPQAASERVASLTDAEVADLAGRIDALPAGGSSWALLLAVIIVLYFLVYVPYYSDKAPPATGKGKPAPSTETK